MPPPTSPTANTSPPKQTPMPAQPFPNPNNKQQQQQQPMYFAEANQYLAYALNVHDIHLKSGTTLPTPHPPVIIEIPDSASEQQTNPIEHIPVSDTFSKEHVLQH